MALWHRAPLEIYIPFALSKLFTSQVKKRN